VQEVLLNIERLQAGSMDDDEDDLAAAAEHGGLQVSHSL
jgi:hypothetical protein